MKDSFVSIATYFTALDANAALSSLREAGIPSFLQGEMTASAFSGNYGMGQQIRLVVARADWKRAADVLTSLDGADRGIDWDDFSAEDGYWICPQCDEAVEEVEAVCPWCGTRLGEAGGP